MARETFENWIPTEMGSNVIQALVQTSATEQLARPEPMASDTKQVPRTGDFAIGAVAKGAAYGETAGVNDYVELIARKVGGILRIAEEDLTDTITGESTLPIKRADAARNMAKFFDNATLATTAAANGTTVLYTSVYKAVRTNDTATGYTADTNYIATGGAATYDDFSDIFAKVEDSDWYDEEAVAVIASPAWKAYLRGIKDDNGDPIWRQGITAGDPGTLLGYPITWSRGARTSAVNTPTPSGNPILIVGNRNLMIKGMARLSPQIANSNPGYALQRAATGVGFTTDEALLKAAMRRGFAVAMPSAFAVLEKS